MENPAIQENPSSLHSSSTHNVQNIRDKMGNLSEAYDEASSWMKNNSRTVFWVLGGLATIGLIGYFFNRQRGSFSADYEV